MAKPILVANWKNHPSSLPEAKDLLRALATKKLVYKKVHLFIAPPFAYLESVSERIQGFAQLGVQNLSLHEKGTFTGEITPEMLKSFGVRLAILGHSERRAMGESVSDVTQKVKIALKSGFTPVICFGEKVKDADGEHFEFLREELKNLLSHVKKGDISSIMLVYEPIWAIGKSAKEAIDPLELSQTVIFIKKVLSDLYGRSTAEGARILYGGSVEPGNAGILMRNSGVQGFLVGHASLGAKDFELIVRSLTE